MGSEPTPVLSSAAAPNCENTVPTPINAVDTASAQIWWPLLSIERAWVSDAVVTMPGPNETLTVRPEPVGSVELVLTTSSLTPVTLIEVWSIPPDDDETDDAAAKAL